MIVLSWFHITYIHTAIRFFHKGNMKINENKTQIINFAFNKSPKLTKSNNNLK